MDIDKTIQALDLVKKIQDHNSSEKLHICYIVIIVIFILFMFYVNNFSNRVSNLEIALMK